MEQQNKMEKEVLIKDEQKTDYQNSQPSQRPLSDGPYRKLALVLMNFILIGNYFCFDNPQAMQTQLQIDYTISPTEYNLLYSIIAFPNMILPLIAGYLTDRLGPRVALVIFTLFVAIGQATFNTGIYLSSIPIMILGRAIFGLGNYTQSIAQSVIVAHWFTGKELAFALGLQDTMFGLCSVLNSFLTPKIVKLTNLFTAALVGTGLSLLSLLFMALLVKMDSENEKRIDHIKKRNQVQDEREQSQINETDADVSMSKGKIQQICQFPRLFWALAIYYGLTGSTFFSFTNIANDYLHNRFDISNIDAGNVLSVLYIFNGFTTPLFGYIVDKIGKRATFMITACILGIIATLIMILIPGKSNYYYILAGLAPLGMFLSLSNAAALPSVPLVLQKGDVGIGYGLYYAVQNIILSVTPLIIANIEEDRSARDSGYYWIQLFLLSLALVSLIESVILQIINKKDKNNILEKPESQIEYQQED